MIGTKANSTSGTATRTNARGSGNNAKTIASTTTFSVGELIMVARTVFGLAPATNRAVVPLPQNFLCVVVEECYLHSKVVRVNPVLASMLRLQELAQRGPNRVARFCNWRNRN